MRKSLLLILLIAFVSCSYIVTIRPNLDVTASIANPINFKVGLYIPPEIKGLMMGDRARWDAKYTFRVGEAVSSIIHKSFQRVFKQVQILDVYPTEVMLTEANIDIVAIVNIPEANASLNLQTGFFSDDASGNVQITANISFFDSKLIQFTSAQATGTGMAKQGVDVFSTGRDEFSAPVENAIRNLGNNIVQQVYGNYDIRKRAEKGYQEY
jgi:hypothetical protein